MNNSQLLRGLLVVVLLRSGVCAVGQLPRVISLEEIFEIAETQSVQLLPSFAAEIEAERGVSVARSGRLPDVNASLSLSYIGDGFTVKRDFSDYKRASIPHFGSGISVLVEQPVYTGGALTGAIDVAELKLASARYATDLKRDNLRFHLAGLYLEIYKYSNLMTVVDNNIEQAQKVLDEMRVRYEQGMALQNDITRYELLVSNLGLQRIKVSNMLDILNTNLVKTAGLPDGTIVEPDSTMLSRSLPLAGEDWWQQEAGLNAAPLRLAQTGVDISVKSDRIVRSERLPKIGLRAGWNIDGPILVEVPPINRNLSYWYVGVGVTYNLSSLYKTNKSLSRSRAAMHRAAAEMDAARESVELSVRGDYVKYMEAYEEFKTQQKSVDLAERNYRTAATRYSAGMALITDMLDAANSKLDAERSLVDARINIIYYYYKLLFTSGKI